MQESRKHHFVPQFLLRPWAIQGLLCGYWWDDKARCLARKRQGPRSFCLKIDLLTLKAHGLGRDAVERVIFGNVDAKGAVARDIILNVGPDRLSLDQRCDFARLLLSLDARRPATVNTLRIDGTKHLVHELDHDPELISVLRKNGIAEAPSAYVENQIGLHLEDRAMLQIQKLVDNPEVGRRLINAFWHLRRLGEADGTLLLADRPLIRIHSFDRPGAAWVLPLTPKAAFIACNSAENLRRLTRLSAERFVKEVNRSSVGQADRFVFSIDRSHERFLAKHLGRS